MSCELQSMHVPVETHPGCQLENSDVVLESSVGAVPPGLFRLFGRRQIFRMDRDSDHGRQKFATVLSMPTQYIFERLYPKSRRNFAVVTFASEQLAV